MCGRFQLELSWAELVALYQLAIQELQAWEPSWSVCPTHHVPTLLHAAPGERALASHRWGFPMPWVAKDGGDPWARPLINAKAEEARGKRTWSGAMRERRCVMPATAFIEWLRVGKKSYPVRFAPTGPGVLHLGALWGEAQRDGEARRVVSVLTTSGSADLAGVHNRMPVLIPADALDLWLDPRTPASTIDTMLAPAPAGTLRADALNTALNRTGAVLHPPEPADWDLADLLRQRA